MDSSKPPSSDLPLALPRVPGPKLTPFTSTARANIEFIEELGDPIVDKDGFVWKVRINGEKACYALKMFRFYSHIYVRYNLASVHRLLASPQRWLDYFDPFFCECRAYGRLNQEFRGDLAVPAYGYLLLTPEQEAEVVVKRGSFGGRDPCDDPSADFDPFGRMDEHAGRPVHCIVKELVTELEPFTPDQVGTLWSDLDGLHNLGVLVRDVRIGNYLGGKLVDFSRAWTMPHPGFELSPSCVDEKRHQDPDKLLEAINNWGIHCRWDWDKVEIPKELELCAWGESENDRYGTDPRFYDWRRWEDDLDAVDAFHRNEVFVQDQEDKGAEEE